jgi:hypothetical protein
MASAIGACSNIGPGTVPRDRADYSAAIGDSWKQQTLRNIVKLRYGDFPVFMEIAQVISGYTFATTATAGFGSANFTSIRRRTGRDWRKRQRRCDLHRPADGGLCTADRKRLHQDADAADPAVSRPVPAAVRLPATVVMPIAVDAINGVANESRRGGHEQARRHGVHSPCPDPLRAAARQCPADPNRSREG